MRYLVYGLVDPRDGHLRYIGKSCSGLRRPRRHCHPSELNRDNTHKGRWIKILIQQGLRPQIVQIQEFSEPDILSEAERFWIAYFRQAGHKLTNLTDGGEGTSGFRGRKQPRLAALNRSRKGIPLSEEHRRRVSDALKEIGHKPRVLADWKGRKHTPEAVQKIKKALNSRPIEDSTGRRFSHPAEAARQLNLHAANIYAVLHGRLKTSGGLTFRYLPVI